MSPESACDRVIGGKKRRGIKRPRAYHHITCQPDDIKLSQNFEIIHEKRQIRQFMEFVLVREDYKLTKPHPEPYLTGLKRLGAMKEETLIVEDSPRGLNSAVAAGIDCVIVSNDFTKAQDFSQASYRIETLIELKDIILHGS